MKKTHAKMVYFQVIGFSTSAEFIIFRGLYVRQYNQVPFNTFYIFLKHFLN